MSVTTYTSDDASAPQLTGEVGSLITVLDAVLVTGYGVLPAAGWAKPYAGTNTAAYRAPAIAGSPSEGMRKYLRVDDALAGSANFARVTGYGTMAAVDDGLLDFPRAYLSSAFWKKSATADTTTRPWLIVASDRAFYAIFATSQTTFGHSVSTDCAAFFGEIVPTFHGDTGATMLAGRSSVTQVDIFGQLDTSPTGFESSDKWLALSRTGLASGAPCSISDRRASPGSRVLGDRTYGCPWPDPIRGGLVLSRITVNELGSDHVRRACRGHLPGAWSIENVDNPGGIYDTFSGSGAFQGKTFIILPVYHGSTEGRMLLETSDTWWD